MNQNFNQATNCCLSFMSLSCVHAFIFFSLFLSIYFLCFTFARNSANFNNLDPLVPLRLIMKSLFLPTPISSGVNCGRCSAQHYITIL